MNVNYRPISRDAIAGLFARESERFAAANPKSRALAERAAAHMPNGVPMHWMTDWATPFALFVASASGASLRDADGHEYADFCLGDTGTMYGHVPPAVASAPHAAHARARLPRRPCIRAYIRHHRSHREIAHA